MGGTYTATQSNTGTISAKVQDCIGVTYTATQSTLELFKLEVDAFINFILAKVKNCKRVAYTATQHWNYLS